MSRPWNDYLRLLEELAGLPEQEARSAAAANAAYDAQGRRLQIQLADADRDFESLKQRNSRLQTGVRDVVRGVGVALPATSSLPPLAPARLGDALKSAEYDLNQLRKTLDYLRTQPPAPRPPAPAPVARSNPVASPPPTPTAPEPPRPNRTPMLAAAALGVVLLIVLAVVLL